MDTRRTGLLPRLEEAKQGQRRVFFVDAAHFVSIFNGDATITSAVLDRLLHHGHTVVIEGSSFRMKDRSEN